MHLTAKDRILLYLLDFVNVSDSAQVPFGMTQEGIARAIWIELPHFSQYVRPLVSEGLLRQRTAHVEAGRRRRKVYALTDSGRLTAIRLRESLKSELVRVRESSGVREARISELLDLPTGKVALLDIVRQALDGGIVDISALAPYVPSRGVEMIADAPVVHGFLGRHDALDVVVKEDGGARIIVIRGIAGMGKTWLAAKACEVLHGRWNLFWHRVRPWDTRGSLLAGLGEFLGRLGRPGLRAVVGRGQAARAEQILREDLPDTTSFLVFDDAHEASGETLQFFRLLADTLSGARGVRILILTRKALPFYDRRDVILRRCVEELDLGALEPQEVAAFLSSEGIRLNPGIVSREVVGHPIFLELVRHQRALLPRALSDLRRFLEEGIYRELSSQERSMMKAASLYQVPVPREALFADPTWSGDVLLSLSDRSLLRRVGDDRYEVHDVIREFFGGLLTPSEASAFRTAAIHQLEKLSDEAFAREDFLGRVGYLSNALRLSPSPPAKVKLWEALGDTNRRIGDVLAASVAFRSAMNLATEDHETLARLHRKMSSLLIAQGDLRSAETEIVAGFQALGDLANVERGWLHVLRCRILFDKGTSAWRESLKHAEAALQLFEPHGILPGQAQALLELGEVTLWWLGKADDMGRPAAEQYFRSALNLAEQAGDFDLAARAHLGMTELAVYVTGDIGQAETHLRAIETMSWPSQDSEIVEKFRFNRGDFNMEVTADFSAAAADFAEGLRVARQLRDDAGIVTAKFHFALLDAHEGKLSKAALGFEEAAREYHRLGIPLVSNMLFRAGVCYLIGGDLEGFKRTLSFVESQELERVGGWYIWAELLRAFDHLLSGREDQAGVGFLQAIEYADELPALSALFGSVAPRVHLAGGVALRVLRREVEAVEHIAHARELLASRNRKGGLILASVWERRLEEGLRRVAPK